MEQLVQVLQCCNKSASPPRLPCLLYKRQLTCNKTISAGKAAESSGIAAGLLTDWLKAAMRQVKSRQLTCDSHAWPCGRVFASEDLEAGRASIIPAKPS